MKNVRCMLMKSVLVFSLFTGLAIGAESSPAMEKYEKQYTSMLNKLQTTLKPKIPKVSPAQQKAYADAGKAIVSLGHALWKAGLTKDPAERKKNVQAVWDKQAKDKARILDLAKKLGVQAYLTSDALDATLVTFIVLHEATPRGLAEFAAKSPANAALIDALLSDTELMKQILIADSPKAPRVGKAHGPAQYGPAMKIYTDIQKASSKATSGIFQRLALAVALEHSIPIKQRNPEAAKDAPETVDPVKRYLHYEKAYVDGELDAGFKDLSTWDMRFVVYGGEPDYVLTWGRKALRNFRPDHVLQPNHGWRYVGIVSSDVTYGSGDVKYDRPELQFFQNILMNGGICGRRAFFGRFVCRAFGIPNIRRPSKGHAALARWTPNGWVVCFGPKWGRGKQVNVVGRYTMGPDFLASTQARQNKDAFMQVKRAYWAATVLGEPCVYGESEIGSKNGGKKGKGSNATSPFWSTVALKTQRLTIQDGRIETQGAVGANLGEADGDEKVSINALTAKDKAVDYAANGVITIPATAFVKPSAPTKKVLAMKSFDDGKQVFMPRFTRQGLTILRGSAWRGGPGGSAGRTKSSGYGKYNNWGFRAAMTHDGGAAPREITVKLADGVTIEFVYIKPGTFIMGGDNTKDSKWSGATTPKHEVTITKGFYMGKYEVTQGQFEAIMGYDPSDKKFRGPTLPANNVSEADAFGFCKKVAIKTGRGVRLPTEAEWEYACRAGSKTKYFYGDDVSKYGDYAWYKANDGGKPHPVGQKKPNPWGLYDVYGNVIERVSDVYAADYYAKSPKKDPTGPSMGRQSEVEYTITAPKGGKYALTVKVVTANYNQKLFVSVNGSEEITTIALPFTCGSWQDSKPVTVSLSQGKNTLTVWRDNPPQKGVAIKSLKATPVP